MILRHSSAPHAAPWILVCVLGALLLSGVPAHAAGGTVSFHASVSGKAHESGSFSHAISSTGDPTNPLVNFTGCAIIKQNKGSISGSYIFKLQTAMIQFAGLKPASPGVNLEVDHFRPGIAAASYSKLNVTGTFAINGHSYGAGSSFHGTVKIQNGGKSGTWIDPAGQRNYPAKIAKPVPGFSFTTSWTCSTVLHLTQQ